MGDLSVSRPHYTYTVSKRDIMKTKEVSKQVGETQLRIWIKKQMIWNNKKPYRGPSNPSSENGKNMALEQTWQERSVHRN